MKRALLLTLVLASAAAAYYPWVRYNNRTGAFVPAPSKFDLSVLPNKTVYYFISENGPVGLLPNDSVTAIHSQIRAGANVWNQVETSDIRIAFGGMRAGNAPATATPSIDVLFEDLPPGVLSQGGPVMEDDDGAAGNQSFIPILRSVVILPRNFPAISAPCPCPSWSDSFFTTVVHEFGHALGLQHSFASSVMSQIVTRGTTKAKALGADDIAGVSWLYPARAFSTTFGSITGRVTNGGGGVAHASVVALSPSGAAVSALTNPDGTYRIEGLPAGQGQQYVVYTHTLPPGADVRAALDADRREIPFPQAFDTVFFPGVRTANAAEPLQVRAGETRDNVNLAVATRRTALSVHNIWTYSFPAGQVAIHPSHVNPLVPNRNFVLAYGAGLLGANNQLAPGLTVSVVGGSPAVTSVRPYEGDARYVRIDLAFNVSTGDRPHHLVFSTPTDTFVLPAGFTSVEKIAPVVLSIVPGSDAAGRYLTITGTGLTEETRILVDGVTAAERSFDRDGQRMMVTLPPAPAGHRATVIAANPDGQTSLFAQAAPAFYTYENEVVPSVSVTANSSLPAGVEALVEITGLNTSFAEGQVQAGFHSSDAVVRRLWVVSPTRLVANVWIAPGAAAGLLPMTVTAGLNSITTPLGLLVSASNARQLSLTPASGSSGSIVPVTIRGSLNGAALAATVNDRPVSIAGVNGNVVLIQIPGGLPVGPATLKLTAGADQSLPIALSVEPPPPNILAAFGTGNALLDANRPGRTGETIRLMVLGLGEGAISTARVSVSVAGIEHTPALIIPMGGAGGHEVHFALLPAVASGIAQTTVMIDGRTSPAYALPIRQ